MDRSRPSAAPAPATDVTSTNGQIAHGVVNFNTDGSINLATSTLFGSAGATPTLAIGASAGGTSPAWASSLGIAGQSLSVDLGQVTQRSLTRVGLPVRVGDEAGGGVPGQRAGHRRATDVAG